MSVSNVQESAEAILTDRKEELEISETLPRDWTEQSDRTICGLLIHADQQSALVCIEKSQRLYRIP